MVTIGILLNSADFSIWAQDYVAGTTKRALTHIQAGGTDLRDLALSSHYGRAVADAGGGLSHRQTGGTDISSLFCAKNQHITAAAISNQIANNGYPGAAVAGIRFNTNGSISSRNNGTYATLGSRWGGTSVSGGDFEMRFVNVSGGAAGADGVWRSLSSTREVSVSATGGAATPPYSNSATVRAEWRKIGETGAAYTYTDEFTLTANFG